MGTRVHLLGPPVIEADGMRCPAPRGSKSWCVLAYLVLTRHPVPRTRLAELLFDEAADPIGALRWTLSQLRRALGDAVRIDGDPITLNVAAGTVVDVDVLIGDSGRQAVTLPGLGHDLLEGVPLRVSPAFELWLSTERRRLAGLTAAVLHEAAHTALAGGQADGAARLAARWVACDPWEERAHELLVRSLLSAGDRAAAQRAVGRCQDLFRSELGIEPSPALTAALSSRPRPPVGASPTAVAAKVEAAIATAQAGAYDAALDALRAAVEQARELSTPEVLAGALCALGVTLVEGVRGADEEAVSLLHEAVLAAQSAGLRHVEAKSAHGLGHVEVLRARYARTEHWFRQARLLADGDPRLQAWIDLHAGFGAVDQGRYATGARCLSSAISLAESAGDWRAVAYAEAARGRLHLLRDELEPARAALVRACDTARNTGYTSLLPMPESLLGEVLLREGDVAGAQEAVEHSYALACQVGDPCWESYSLRARGLLAEAQGEYEEALQLLMAAPEACRNRHGTHDWVQAFSLDALCGFAVRRRVDRAAQWAEELAEFASRRGMRELTVRAALHRAALGEPGARELAALLAEDVDNPALHRLLQSPAVPSVLPLPRGAARGAKPVS